VARANSAPAAQPVPPAGLETAEEGGDERWPARRALAEGAAALGLPLSETQLDRFCAYAALLAAGRREFNLTALTRPLDVAIKHFLDSLTIVPVLPPAPHRLIDVGTGAGFPGLPIKLVRPDIDVTLLEATAKKAAWLQSAVAALGLDGIAVVAARAEDVGRDPAYRGRFDVAVARALAPLPVVCELCLPFVRPGGLLVAQKTTVGVTSELPRARRALEVLGGRVREVRAVPLAQLPNRVLVIIEQERPVPDAYPRRPGIPAKRPL
jgi:16S rRNA (guanine527-N7)-methyltransferase